MVHLLQRHNNLTTVVFTSVDAAASGGAGIPLGSKTKAFAEAHIGRIMIGHYDASAPLDNEISILQLEVVN